MQSVIWWAVLYVIVFWDHVCKDYDIECFGISVDDFEKAMDHLGAQGVGKSFFVYKYRHLDISLPRTEKKICQGTSKDLKYLWL